jgi:hypothetical protein
VAAGAIALGSLVTILGVSVSRVAGAVEADTFQRSINWATLGWFLSAPLWLTPGLFGLFRLERPLTGSSE